MSETSLIEWTDHETCSYGKRGKTRYHVVPSESGRGFIAFIMTPMGRTDLEDGDFKRWFPNIAEAKNRCDKHAVDDELEKWPSPGLMGASGRCHHSGVTYVYDSKQYKWVRKNVLEWRGTDDCASAKHPSGKGSYVVCRESRETHGRCWMATCGYTDDPTFQGEVGALPDLQEKCETNAREWVDSKSERGQ